MAKLHYNLDEIQDFTLEAGRYRAKLIKVEQTLSSKKKPMLVWYWKIVSGSEKGKEIRSYTSLVETALGNLKNHLMAFRLQGKVNTDTSKLIGKYAILIVALSVSTSPGREGTMFSNVAAVNPDKGAGADLDEDDDEVEDEDDETEYDEDEDEDESDDEDEDDEEEPELVRKSSPKKKIKSTRRVPKPEEDEDDDEEEPEEERPILKSSKKVVAEPGKSKRRIVEDDEEELEDERPRRSSKIVRKPVHKVVRKSINREVPF